MAIEVRIPASMRSLTGGEAVVEAAGGTLDEVLGDLEARYPGLAHRLLDDSGLRRYVNVYVDGRDVRFLAGLRTEIGESASITILPAVMGE